MKTVDSNQMRRQNSKSISRLIWSSADLSRADISRLTGMSRSSISDIVSELIDQNLVLEVGAGPSKGGRKPRILKFNDNAHSIISLNFKSNQTQLTVLNLRSRVLATETLDLGLEESPNNLIAALQLSLTHLKKQKFVDSTKIIGVGVALPCPVNPNSDSPISEVLFPNWQGYNLRMELERMLTCPVICENDANLGALAEYWWGQRKTENLIYITVNDGYGAGILMNGKVFRGHNGMAGEIGHMIVDASSDKLHKGISGSLSSFLTQTEILKHYNRQKSLGKLENASYTIDSLITEAHAGKKAALATVDYIVNYLGIAMANLIHVLDINNIVMDGSIVQIKDLVFEKLRTKVEKLSLWPDSSKFSISPSSLGKEQISIGAGTLILDAFLSGTLKSEALFQSANSDYQH